MDDIATLSDSTGNTIRIKLLWLSVSKHGYIEGIATAADHDSIQAGSYALRYKQYYYAVQAIQMEDNKIAFTSEQ